MVPFLDLGEQPLANAYRFPGSPPTQRYPLAVVRCRECTLVQLSGTVPPEDMFDDYLYYSSYSDAMDASASALASRVVADLSLGSGDLVAEIASNDGYLLQHYRRQGIEVLGVEPAKAIAAAAQARGIPTLTEYFGSNLARRLASVGRPPSVIHANNVIAHAPDINDFVEGLAILANASGVILIETPWLVSLVKNIEFDTIYHEHVFYYSLTALSSLFRRHHLAIVSVERLDIHGGSLRLTVRCDGAAKPDSSVGELIETEKALGIWQGSFYDAFAERVDAVCKATIDSLRRFKSLGASIAAYGAAAKGTVLLNHLGLGRDLVDFVVDRNEHKQGRLMPGVDIPIRAPSALCDDMPDYVLLLAWNFADEIIAQQQDYINRGGRLIVPIPQYRVVGR